MSFGLIARPIAAMRRALPDRSSLTTLSRNRKRREIFRSHGGGRRRSLRAVSRIRSAPCAALLEEAGANSFPGWLRNSPWLRRTRGAGRLASAVVLDGWSRARRSVGPMPDHRSEVRTADSDRQSAARESPARDRAQRQPGVCCCAGVGKPVSVRENLSDHLSGRHHPPNQPAGDPDEAHFEWSPCTAVRPLAACFNRFLRTRGRVAPASDQVRAPGLIQLSFPDSGQQPKRRERTFRCDESPWSRETIREFFPDRSADKPQPGSATLPILRSEYSFRGSGFRLPGR